MTLDQVLVLVLPDSAFGGLTKATPAQAIQDGHVDRSRILPQSKAARIRAELAAKGKGRKRRRQRR